MFQQFEYLVGCKPLGIEHQLNAHLLEQQPVLRGQEIIVINPGGNLLGSQVLGQQGAHDVDVLRDERNDRDEQVGILDLGLPHDLEGGWGTFDRDYVRDVGNVPEPLGIVVDDSDVVGFLAQHLCQVGSDFSRTLNDNFHILFLMYANIRFPFTIAKGTIHLGNNDGASMPS